MRVLITGGYGCIGSWIVRNLLDRGDEACVFDLKHETHRLKLLASDDEIRRVSFIAGDVTDFAALQKAIDDQGITHVIHLAGLQVPTCRANPMLGAKVNVLGTLAVFEAVKAALPRVQRLVYASSAAVFAPPDHYTNFPPPLPDDAPLAPSTHYGIFKVCNEGNARIYYQDHGLSSIGLRPGSVYGVGRDFGMTSEPTKAIKSVALGRKFHISYGGQQDLQLADDIAKAFVRCLDANYEGAKSYNLRGTVTDQAMFVWKLSQVATETQKLITHGDRQLTVSYDFDDAAVQRDLGPMPVTPLEMGIGQTLAHFRRLNDEGRLDTADLEPASPVT